MKKYLELIVVLLQELPFFNYIVRLFGFVKQPNITKNEISGEQLKHSLLDVVNALGLSAVLIATLILIDSRFYYLGVITVFNPVYVVGTCIYYSLIISITVATCISLLTRMPWLKNDLSMGDVFYLIFTHNLRSYAALCFVLAPMVVYVVGRMLMMGESINVAFSYSLFWFFIIAISFLLVIFRLHLNPMYKFLNPSRYKSICYILIVASVLVAVNVNAMLSLDLEDKLVLRKNMCDWFKSGDFYANLNETQRNAGEKLFCY